MGLTRGPNAFKLRFDRAEIVDLSPPPGPPTLSAHVSAGSPTVRADLAPTHKRVRYRRQRPHQATSVPYSCSASTHWPRSHRLDIGSRWRGYGFGAFGDRGLAKPYAGLSLGEGGARTWRGGVRWTLGRSLDLGLEGSRDEAANDNDPEPKGHLRRARRAAPILIRGQYKHLPRASNSCMSQRDGARQRRRCASADNGRDRSRRLRRFAGSRPLRTPAHPGARNMP